MAGLEINQENRAIRFSALRIEAFNQTFEGIVTLLVEAFNAVVKDANDRKRGLLGDSGSFSLAV